MLLLWYLMSAACCDCAVQEYEGSAFQTREQKQWSDMQRLLRSIKPSLRFEEPDNRLRLLCFRCVTHAWFDMGIMGCILVNTLTMTFEHYDQTDA